MSKINNITKLREYALEVLENLREGKIEINEALAAGKSVDSVIATIKIEMDYQRITGEVKQIPFMSNNEKIIEHEKVPLLPSPKNKKK